MDNVFLCKVCGIGFFQQKLRVNTNSNSEAGRKKSTNGELSWRGGGGATRSARIDCVCCEAVEARTKMACLGFSTALGARFSSNRFVRAFLGFLCCQK